MTEHIDEPGDTSADTEGHGHRTRLDDADGTEVSRTRLDDADTDDTEGHANSRTRSGGSRTRVDDVETDDTEGHGHRTR